MIAQRVPASLRHRDWHTLDHTPYELGRSSVRDAVVAFTNGWKQVFSSVFVKHYRIMWDWGSVGASSV